VNDVNTGRSPIPSSNGQRPGPTLFQGREIPPLAEWLHYFFNTDKYYQEWLRGRYAYNLSEGYAGRQYAFTGPPYHRTLIRRRQLTQGFTRRRHFRLCRRHCTATPRSPELILPLITNITAGQPASWPARITARAMDSQPPGLGQPRDFTLQLMTLPPVLLSAVTTPPTNVGSPTTNKQPGRNAADYAEGRSFTLSAASSNIDLSSPEEQNFFKYRDHIFIGRSRHVIAQISGGPPIFHRRFQGMQRECITPISVHTARKQNRKECPTAIVSHFARRGLGHISWCYRNISTTVVNTE